MTDQTTIQFTQYMLPDGRAQQVDLIVDDPSTARMASEILMQKGYRFECEVLTNGVVSLTCANTLQGIDIAIELCPNGPGIKAAVGRMVASAHAFIFKNKKGSGKPAGG